MSAIAKEIRAALESELQKIPAYYTLEIEKKKKHDEDIWTLTVDVSGMREALDESFEGATVWWAHPKKGAADVLSVLPDRHQINLRYCTSDPPEKGRIRIYPARYLEPLVDIWKDPSWTPKSLVWIEKLNNKDIKKEEGLVLDTRHFPSLREAQKKAFALLQWEVSYLWGPPGTGKTYTLGAFLAQYLRQFEDKRVLLLSTTNNAVDHALIAVDTALDQVGTAGSVKHKCVRLGNHFIASHYENRQHLIPVRDETLIRRLVALEKERPETEEVTKYAKWKARVEAARGELRAQMGILIRQKRLVAMTTTRAVFTLKDLKDQRFDLIVFDEASQVSLAHATALMPLSNRFLFAGDPKQLAPIVRSKTEYAKKWLGESAFTYMDTKADWTCLLNEQSRMIEPICRLVSELFYEKKLVVAEKENRDPKWRQERFIRSIESLKGVRHIHVVNIKTNGIWSKKYRGPIRFDSAERIQQIVIELTSKGRPESDIIVLTPFRAQRILIRKILHGIGLKKVQVSTVHRAQGSERHTVIFDPVDARRDFLNEKMNSDAPRLINVAISRAKAHLIVLLSDGDRSNRIMDQANLIINDMPTKILRFRIRPV